MGIQLRAVLSAALAYVIGVGLTPLTIRIAPYIGAVDVPRDGRRMHKTPIPRAGGIAVFLSFLAAVALIGRAERGMIRFLFGALIIVLLGIFDDVFRLPALGKLAAQTLACILAVASGGLAGVIEVVWMLALVNAHNMIDGLDGLAAGISATEAFALAVVLALEGKTVLSGAALALCGSALAFLRYNRHPARVFMGDTGSQFLGFSLAYLSLQATRNGEGPLRWMIAPLVFALPLSDLVFAVVRRIARGESPFAADRGHWHHRLIDAGLGQRKACFWLLLCAGFLSLAGVLVSREEWYGFAVFALLGTACVVMTMEMLYGKKRGT